MYLTNNLIHSDNFFKSDGVTGTMVPVTFQDGAEVIFLGKVRNHSDGRSVLYLHYEAYESMAEQLIDEAIQKAYRRWPITHARVLHRLGRVDLGEIAVVVQVCAAHRDEAYRASRFLIETIKHQVPIWKKEYFEDGTSFWSLCHAKEEMHADLRTSA